MSDRWLLVVGFGIQSLCLGFIAYQTVILSRMLAHMADLLVRTH